MLWVEAEERHEKRERFYGKDGGDRVQARGCGKVPARCGNFVIELHVGRPPPMNDTFAAAEAIAACRRNRTPLHPLAGDSAPQTEAEGYRIADAVHGLLSRGFGEMVGHKSGCTSAVVQP